MSTPFEPHERAAHDFAPTDELIRRHEGWPSRSLDELPGQDPFGSDMITLPHDSLVAARWGEIEA
jgi:hypothetical protein